MAQPAGILLRPDQEKHFLTVKAGKEREERVCKKEPGPSQKPSRVVSALLKESEKQSVPGGIPTKKKKQTPPPSIYGRESKKSSFHRSKCTSSKYSSPATAFQRSSQSASRHYVSGALRVSKTTYTIPKRLPQQESPPAPSISVSSSSSREPVSLAHTPTSRPSQPQPNSQIRHNIRRSLTEIMFKRVSDSDDLHMSASEVGKLAISIEKEMYNLFFDTDSKYKNKYRSIMFSLKDPKNKGLFYRVIMGEVTPCRLVRLTPEELLSKDMSEWRHREATEVLEPSPKAQPEHEKLDLIQEAPPNLDEEESLPLSGDEQEELSPTATPIRHSQPSVVNSVPEIFSRMLKDTTAEHRTHLFHLNCKICTGQMSADDEPIPKKPKLSVSSAIKRSELKDKQVPSTFKGGDSLGNGVGCPPLDSEMSIFESPASPDDSSSTLSLSQSFSPVTIPEEPTVSITGRDPRTASYRPAIAVTSAVCPVSSSTKSIPDIKPVLPLPPPSSPAIPKSILRNHTSSPHIQFFGTSGSSSSMMDSLSYSPLDEETTVFLSKQEILWKGFINMPTVAKFVTKAYLVSGSFEYLEEDLPDTIQIGGRISPNTVWDYVGKLKTSFSKELCLIRFHPATEEEEVAYISLFSYFNSRGRFGVVANNSHHIKDLYIIPLGAKDSIPSKLLPFDGPGLEQTRRNLLLGLVVSQKQNCSKTCQEGKLA
ncbi:hypothetical protein MATL_G00108350 [Megalops atlanticus]|uniref:TFIIS central domain-containing protein n=1 Tax=Megalops atlanticus TaxID=7932 RepID=A0A9D3TDT0_MEGAT|nr:hypothetical protein MATL_G00108350 [Megalops atlanticus]